MPILQALLSEVKSVQISGTTEKEVTHLTFDSRKVAPGVAFFAIRGVQADGHDFILKAIEAGSPVIICEAIPAPVNPEVTYIQVANSSEAMAYMAAAFYNHPAKKLKLVGVTGTNGKTTCVTLLHKLFLELGYHVGLLSTVQNQIDGTIIPATHTTPDAISLNALLAQMVKAGCTYCFMEVSSHALVQHRVTGLNFTGALFTNITHDHLDYHKTFDEYIKAKKIFFDNLSKEAFALINEDDKRGRVMLQNTRAKTYSYSLRSVSDFKAKIVDNSIQGLHLEVDNREVYCKLIGTFNAYNLLAVYGAAVLLGEEADEVLTTLSSLSSAAGRFDYIVSDSHITGIVDYAHTPDALQNVLNTIKQIRQAEQQVITVVGCGGNRDATKRPIMADIACQFSDRVILTSDNPRFEDPQEILNQMQAGVKPIDIKKTLTVPDRREAIKTACMLAKPQDIILIAGKGHETYQEVKGVKSDFDDKKVLEEMFRVFSK